MIGSINTIFIKKLSIDECWRSLTFFDRSNEKQYKLEIIGPRIVGKCKGLSLVEKTNGVYCGLKILKKHWQNILESEMWKLEERLRKVFDPSNVELSYKL